MAVKVKKLRRDNVLSVSLSDDEYNKVAKEAFDKNMHMSEYVRWVLEWRRTLLREWEKSKSGRD